MPDPESQRKPDRIKKWLHIANVPIGLALVIIGIVVALRDGSRSAFCSSG